MKTLNQTQLDQFKAAKQIALTIGKNQMRRARLNNVATNYVGANIDGKMYVIADSEADLQNADATIDGNPAREIFGDFSVMSN